MNVKANGEPIMDPTLSQILTRLLWLEGARTSLEQQLQTLDRENQRLVQELETLKAPTPENGRNRKTAAAAHDN